MEQTGAGSATCAQRPAASVGRLGRWEENLKLREELQRGAIRCSRSLEWGLGIDLKISARGYRLVPLTSSFGE